MVGPVCAGSCAGKTSYFPNSNSETVNIDLSWWISSLSYEHHRYQTNEFFHYFDIYFDITT
ncbi:hypothetical protein CPter291_3751 [Collimonas pratensis]|uniref:Uncharacterized protein n=1 Tax=Collimonas pratensis TaxID=279113 RepID=A0ABN4MEH1_9BURK|nr:hypothetical protein CPter291_3751 [Collimonas pratensis]